MCDRRSRFFANKYFLRGDYQLEMDRVTKQIKKVDATILSLDQIHTLLSNVSILLSIFIANYHEHVEHFFCENWSNQG